MGKSNYFSSKSVFGQLISLNDDKKIKYTVKKTDSDRYEIALRPKTICDKHALLPSVIRF